MKLVWGCIQGLRFSSKNLRKQSWLKKEKALFKKLHKDRAKHSRLWQRISKDGKARKGKIRGNPPWLKSIKGCRWEEQMVTDPEWHAKECGFIFEEFHPLLWVGLDYPFYRDKTAWKMNSGEMWFKKKKRETQLRLFSSAIQICLNCFLVLTRGCAIDLRERREGEMGRKNVNAREKHQSVPLQTHNPGMFPDQESSLRPFGLWDNASTNWATQPGQTMAHFSTTWNCM